MFATEVEKLSAVKPLPWTETRATRVLRRVLWPVAVAAELRVAEPLTLGRHERENEARRRARRRRVAEAWRVKDERNALEQQQKDAKIAERQRQKRARQAEWHRAKNMKKLKR